MGTGTIACQFKEYLSYSEAIKIVHSLKIKTRSEWRRLCQLRVNGISILPKDIPIAPEQVYKNSGWNGYGEWLGTGAIAPQLKKYKSYTKARAFVRSLKLKSQREWIKFCKGQMPSKGTLPLDIPANPHNTYRNKGWKSLGDWLGTGTIAPHFKKYRSFLDARAFARSLRLKSQCEWRKFCKGQLPLKGLLPNDIPANPNQTYKNIGWINLGGRRNFYSVKVSG